MVQRSYVIPSLCRTRPFTCTTVQDLKECSRWQSVLPTMPMYYSHTHQVQRTTATAMPILPACPPQVPPAPAPISASVFLGVLTNPAQGTNKYPEVPHPNSKQTPATNTIQARPALRVELGVAPNKVLRRAAAITGIPRMFRTKLSNKLREC